MRNHRPKNVKYSLFFSLLFKGITQTTMMTSIFVYEFINEVMYIHSASQM